MDGLKFDRNIVDWLTSDVKDDIVECTTETDVLTCTRYFIYIYKYYSSGSRWLNSSIPTANSVRITILQCLLFDSYWRYALGSHWSLNIYKLFLFFILSSWFEIRCSRSSVQALISTAAHQKCQRVREFTSHTILSGHVSRSDVYTFYFMLVTPLADNFTRQSDHFWRAS